MRLLLDTDICIYTINARRPEALARLRDYALGEVGIPAITCAELRFGVRFTVVKDRGMVQGRRRSLDLG